MSVAASLAASTPALLLAAGRGERMRPLTDHCPKPLLEVQGRPLLQWQLDALGRDGCRQVVINTDWLGGQIHTRIGDRHAWGPETGPSLAIRYSDEGRDFGGALETAGGIARALPLLGDLFWVAAGDVFAPDFVFDSAAIERFAASDALAHLWLVPNPAHHPRGDFGLGPQGLALNLGAGDPRPRYTYSTIGLYRAALFSLPGAALAHGNPDGVKAPLAPLLRLAMDQGRIGASLYRGRWTDVGTPQRLADLNTPPTPTSP
ncbi:MAG: nucleotidyltransferase family protein [Curvibacter sp.]|nr:nucleotidyltransferase family protein [Curvibacter sp.]